MNDPNSLLATLAQSSAAIVAIVGGFLVSRLVALSSEREGLGRQVVAALDRLQHVRQDYDAALEYRFGNSQADFEEWVISDVVAHRDQLDIEATLTEHCPRGSSESEMRPVLESLLAEVAAVDGQVRTLLRPNDDETLRTSDLEERGLKFPESRRWVYEQVVDHLAETELPAQRPNGLGIVMPSFIVRDSALVAGDHGTASRRLDESIAEEQRLAGQVAMLETDIRRLEGDLAEIGRPVGVTSAIAILTLYSALGIGLPVTVMALDPASLSGWIVALLVGLFGVGLAAVLGYMLWYAKTLNDPIDSNPENQD